MDAALLIAGVDPSQYKELRGQSTYEAIRTGTFAPDESAAPTGYDPAFRALQAAIRRGTLKAELRYTGERAGWAQSSSAFAISTADLTDLQFIGSDGSLPNGSKLRFQREPHWRLSVVDVDDLKAWLRSRGVSTGFFFPKEELRTEDFLNKAHDHFAPELALAVAAWRALAEQQTFPHGYRAAIERWIESHPEAWQGDDPPSDKAKDRIATLVNWNQKGGAPKSGS